MNLYASLTTLTEEVDRIKALGDILTDAKIDSAIPAGSTVGGTPSRQYRLRVKGQKTRYLKACEVAEARAAIQRGKAIRKLEKSIEQIKETIATAESVVGQC